jgi:hypothetical protein
MTFHQRPIDPVSVPAGACRINQQRGEPLHPPVDGNMINHDAPLGQQLLHIAVGEAVAQVPPHRDHDHPVEIGTQQNSILVRLLEHRDDASPQPAWTLPPPMHQTHTATSCRSTRISTSFDRELRASSPSQDITCRKISYNSSTATTGDHAQRHRPAMPQATPVDGQFDTQDVFIARMHRTLIAANPMVPLVVL